MTNIARRIGSLIGVIIVASVLSLDGLMFVTMFLFLFSIGGWLTLLWPSFAITSLILAVGGTILIAIFAFIIIPLIHVDIVDND